MALAAFLGVLETHRGFGGKALFRMLNFEKEDKPSQLLLCGNTSSSLQQNNQTKPRLKTLSLCGL